VIRKHTIVNALFLLAFPVYGIGTHLAFKGNFSVGFITAISPFLAILLFYLIDLIYRGRIQPMVNRVYWLGMLTLASLVWSMWAGFLRGHPGLNPINTTSFCLVFLVPFNAAVVVQVYNRANDKFDFARMMLYGLSLLILVNFLGYAAGMRNITHQFEGRINLPFMHGLYDAAHLMSIINLMLLFYIKDFTKRPFLFIVLVALYLANMVVMISVNSRLSLMIFMLLTVLFVTKLIKNMRGIYTVSLFTMPLLVGFANLIYIILSQPFFVALFKRVDKEDVTTFNGRTYIWERIGEWATDDRRGIIFGNGYHGQYKYKMLEFVNRMWGGHGSYDLHLHSSFLEITVNEGIVGLFLCYAVYWTCFKYYRQQYRLGTQLAPLFAALVYLLFIWQIDIFAYGIDMGWPILLCLLSAIAIDPKYITRRPRDLDGQLLS
jgi:O-antigen ligase